METTPEEAKSPEASAPELREIKRAPNRLVVDESHGEGDNSCVMLSLAKMEGESFGPIFVMSTFMHNRDIDQTEPLCFHLHPNVPIYLKNVHFAPVVSWIRLFL